MTRLENPRLLCCLLAAATFILYAQSIRFDFINYDDPSNITENAYVRGGITGQGVLWAFAATEVDYWKPVTWLSHMLDCQLFGLNPHGHHLTNVLFHIANVLLCFTLWNRVTGKPIQSALIAGLFAVHPLHISSVAWVTERKDMLSTLFWMLSLHAYVRYVEQPRSWRYGLLLLCFALGLMAKPMIITLPFVLWVMDFWPLRRTWSRRLIVEKVPLLILALLSCGITLAIGRATGQIASVGALPLQLRVVNAVVSYATYLTKVFWPDPLSVYYPHPGHWSAWIVIASAFLLLLVTICVWMARWQRPYLLTGWLWYLGTLIPVIGLIQGSSGEAMADRFTYIPLTGIYLMVIWGATELFDRWHTSSIARVAFAAACLLALGTHTSWQLGYWKDSVRLFQHALEVTPRNSLAHNNLGAALLNQGKREEAVAHFRSAIRDEPEYADARFNLGTAFAMQGNVTEAVSEYTQAIRLKPHSALWRHELGLVLARQGRTDEAITQFTEAVRIKPDFAEGHNDLGVALAGQKELETAIEHFTAAVRLKPDYTAARDNLQMALADLGTKQAEVAQVQDFRSFQADFTTTCSTAGAKGHGIP